MITLLLASIAIGAPGGLVAFHPRAPIAIVSSTTTLTLSPTFEHPDCVGLGELECELVRAALYWERRAREAERDLAKEQTDRSLDVLALRREIALLEERPRVAQGGIDVWTVIGVGAGALGLGAAIGAVLASLALAR